MVIIDGQNGAEEGKTKAVSGDYILEKSERICNYTKPL